MFPDVRFERCLIFQTSPLSMVAYVTVTVIAWVQTRVNSLDEGRLGGTHRSRPATAGEPGDRQDTAAWAFTRPLP